MRRFLIRRNGRKRIGWMVSGKRWKTSKQDLEEYARNFDSWRRNLSPKLRKFVPKGVPLEKMMTDSTASTIQNVMEWLSTLEKKAFKEGQDRLGTRIRSFLRSPDMSNIWDKGTLAVKTSVQRNSLVQTLHTGKHIAGHSMESVSTPKPTDMGPPKEQRPLLLVPGLLGQVCMARRREYLPKGEEHAYLEPADHTIWMRFRNVDEMVERYMYSTYDPVTRYARSRSHTHEIYVPQDRHGLYAIEHIHYMHVLGPMVPYFHLLSSRLRTRLSYVPGKTLFGFPYDFRQHSFYPVLIQRLRARLQSLARTSPDGRVDVLSHSYGGLLMKALMYAEGGRMDGYVGNWISVATPFWGGGAKATMAMLSGYDFDMSHVNPAVVRNLQMTLPCAYELLPKHGEDWPVKQRPMVEYTMDKTSVQVDTDQGLIQLLERVNADRGSFSWNKDIIHSVQERNKRCAQVPMDKLQGRMRYHCIYGSGVDTPVALHYETPIEQLQDLKTANPSFRMGDGDYVVPAASAMGDGLHATTRLGFPRNHIEILFSPDAYEAIESILTSRPHTSQSSS